MSSWRTAAVLIAALAAIAGGCGDEEEPAPTAVATPAGGATAATAAPKAARPATSGDRARSPKGSRARAGKPVATPRPVPSAGRRARRSAGRKPAPARPSRPAPAPDADSGAPSPPAAPANGDPVSEARAAAEAVFAALAARDAQRVCHELYTQQRMETMSGEQGEAAVRDCEQRTRKGTPVELDRVEGAAALDADTVQVDVELRAGGYTKPTRLVMVRQDGRWKLDRSGLQR